MNHDYAHCADWKPDCPEQCFRGQLVIDLHKRQDLCGVPMSWAHLKGTDECIKEDKE